MDGREGAPFSPSAARLAAPVRWRCPARLTTSAEERRTTPLMMPVGRNLADRQCPFRESVTTAGSAAARQMHLDRTTGSWMCWSRRPAHRCGAGTRSATPGPCPSRRSGDLDTTTRAGGLTVRLVSEDADGARARVLVGSAVDLDVRAVTLRSEIAEESMVTEAGPVVELAGVGVRCTSAEYQTLRRSQEVRATLTAATTGFRSPSFQGRVVGIPIGGASRSGLAVADPEPGAGSPVACGPWSSIGVQPDDPHHRHRRVERPGIVPPTR